MRTRSWTLVFVLACASTAPEAPIERAVAEEPAPQPETQSGAITVSVSHDWGAVWIDGVQVTDETPLNMWDIDAGPHRVRVAKPDGTQLYEDTVEVRADEMVIVHVAPDGSARLERVEH